MDYTEARIVLSCQVNFRNCIKEIIVNNQSLYNEAFECDKTNTPSLKRCMRKWKEIGHQFSPEEKKEILQIYRVRLNRMSNTQWRIKYFDCIIKLYKHIHNFNIDNAVLYVEKLKELSHEGMEINERLCDVDPNYGVNITEQDEDEEEHNSYDKQYAYKQICDYLIDEIKLAESYMEDCKRFVVAKEVIEAKKNMITRQKKR